MAMVDAVMADFGKIDILVNNAGNVVEHARQQADRKPSA